MIVLSIDFSEQIAHTLTQPVLIGFTNHRGWIQPVLEETMHINGTPRTVWRIGHPGYIMHEKPVLSIDYNTEEKQP